MENISTNGMNKTELQMAIRMMLQSMQAESDKNFNKLNDKMDNNDNIKVEITNINDSISNLKQDMSSNKIENIEHFNNLKVEINSMHTEINKGCKSLSESLKESNKEIKESFKENKLNNVKSINVIDDTEICKVEDKNISNNTEVIKVEKEVINKSNNEELVNNVSEYDNVKNENIMSSTDVIEERKDKINNVFNYDNDIVAGKLNKKVKNIIVRVFNEYNEITGQTELLFKWESYDNQIDNGDKYKKEITMNCDIINKYDSCNINNDCNKNNSMNNTIPNSIIGVKKSNENNKLDDDIDNDKVIKKEKFVRKGVNNISKSKRYQVKYFKNMKYLSRINKSKERIIKKRNFKRYKEKKYNLNKKNKYKDRERKCNKANYKHFKKKEKVFTVQKLRNGIG